MLNLKNDQTQAIGTKIRHGDPGALILSRCPLGNLNPRAPVSSHVCLSIEPPPNAIKSAVLAGSWVIDAQNDQLWQAVVIEVDNGDVSALIFKRRPIGNSNEIKGHVFTPMASQPTLKNVSLRRCGASRSHCSTRFVFVD
jgi:hypothetical protein